jgi:hypothetical protein
MNKGDADSERDEAPLIVEAYGFKVNIKSRPDDLGEHPPSSWRDVPSFINQHLMRIAVAPTRLVAEVLEGATRLIRGLSRIPSSVANKLHRAHFEADAVEKQRQQLAVDVIKHKVTSAEPTALLTDELSSEDMAEQAINQIQALLRKYRDKGLDAYIIFRSDGKPVIVIGTQTQSESQVLDAIKQTEIFLNQSTEHDH